MVNTANSKITGNTKDLREQEHLSLISNEKLLEIYAAMLKCRMLKQRATEYFPEGKLTSDFGRSVAREALAAAVAIDLVPGDMLCIPPGDWLPAFVKGMSAESVLLALAPAVESTRAASITAAEAERGNILLASDTSIQRSSVLQRARDARAQKDGTVVAVFISSAPASLGGWPEVMISAAAETLPIVFVHHADGAEIGIPSSSSRSRNPEALFHGVPSIFVDATDPVAIYRVAFEAVLRARQNRGASLLECIAVPGTTEKGVGTETGYSSSSFDPVSTMESYLERKGIELSKQKRHIVENFHRELDLATRFLQR